MNTKTAKLLAALQAERAAAQATKAAALSVATAEGTFYAACDRIRELESQIHDLESPRRPGYRCANTAALVAANVD